MRRLHYCSIFILAFVLIAFLSCNKDSSTGTGNSSDYRVVSEKDYEDGSLVGSTKVTYSNNKITKISTTGDGYSSVSLFDYPEQNTVVEDWTFNDGGDIYTSETEYTFSDNLLVEVKEDEDEKTTITYNLNNQVDELQHYYFDTDWYLSSIESYTYSNGKLAMIVSGSVGYEEYKSVFTYNGDEIDNITSYYAYGDGWEAEDKDVYTYTDGNITKIRYYYYDGSDWLYEGIYDDYKYNANGNLIENSGTGDYDYTFKYTFERGQSNLNLLYGFYNLDDKEPVPFKKAPAAGFDNRFKIGHDHKAVKNHSRMNRHLGRRK
jgi:hypothetical protein